ncbi:uncharacterized protein LOC126736916 [Anthonomus grandis grandis]|uniref:uncharacterized protein LOC126736916 n=1 Tax=Anthonomus grandis grandis TaxID=2921223 RepID=UPI00216671F6|nr:uncharacterized protein LOC126736916 [Anthonomus grandis grandis]
MGCITCLLIWAIIVLIIIKLYIKLTTGWCRSNVCLVGKTAVITGANTGIGYETAADFAKRGARVILACRSESRGQDAVQRIIRETDNENVVFKQLDLASFKSVREFAKDINATEERLDILVNNAGIGNAENKQTEDGLLILMQSNHFGHFLLTNLLLDLLKKTKNSRIVNVASLAGKYAKDFNVNRLNEFPEGHYRVGGPLYRRSKLCNILFTIELAQRLKGTGVTAYSLHPGVILTEFIRDMSGWRRIVAENVLKWFFKTPIEGAQTTIYCSVAKGIESDSGEHFADCAFVTRYKTAEDPDLPKKLWEISEKLVKLGKTALIRKKINNNSGKYPKKKLTKFATMGCVTYLVFWLAIILIIVKLFIKLTTGWCRSNVCLVGKTAVITGANTGIGYETAADFAKRGARVILACRNESKGQDAVDRIVKSTNNPNVVFKPLDLSSFKSIREFAKDINATEERLDILVNNAGAGGYAKEKSVDGLLLLMQTNYFGHFLLTNLLLDILKKTGNSRIVNVSSIGARSVKDLDVNNLNAYPEHESRLPNIMVYARSKLCNILFTIELAKRLRGTSVTTYSLHPGAVFTDIFNKMPAITRVPVTQIINWFFKSAIEGAQTSIYCSVAKGIESLSGEHFADCAFVTRYKSAQDPELPKKLWQVSEELVNLKSP